MSDPADVETFKRFYTLLDHRIAEVSKEDIAECARVLALDLAKYRLKFGDMPATDYEALASADTIDADTAKLLVEGTLQCLVVLNTVAPPSPDEPMH